MKRNGNDALWQKAEKALWAADWSAARGHIDELLEHHRASAVDCMVTVHDLAGVGIICPPSYREVLETRIKAWNEACYAPLRLEFETVESRPAV